MSALSLVACGGQLPRFAAGAALTIDDVSTTRVAVSWPPAEHATAYVVRVDGEPVARLGPEARSYAAGELPEASAHAFAVEAIDADGRASTVLRATAITLDGTAPSFPEDAQLSVTETGPPPPIVEPQRRTVELRWPAAEDAVGVVRYRVLRGEEELARVDAPATQASLADIVIDEGDRFTVRALDRAGNESAAITSAPWSAPRPAIEPAHPMVEELLLGALGSDGALADMGASGGGLRQRGGDHGGGGIAELVPRVPASPVVRGEVRLGEVRSTGGSGRFDVAILQRQLGLRNGVARRCYERELRTNPTLAGTIEAELAIEVTGSVTRVRVVRGVAPAVDACVARMLSSLRFNPGADGGSATFALSFALSPQSVE